METGQRRKQHLATFFPWDRRSRFYLGQQFFQWNLKTTKHTESRQQLIQTHRSVLNIGDGRTSELWSKVDTDSRVLVYRQRRKVGSRKYV